MNRTKALHRRGGWGRILFWFFFGLAFGLLVNDRALAQEEHREILAAKFQAHLDTVANELPGILGISIIDIDSGQTFGANDRLIFPQASAIKVAILVTLYFRQEQGEIDLTRSVEISAADRVGGTGFLTYFDDSTSSLSLHDLAVMMITVSDNMATNILIDNLGMENVTGLMSDLGLSEIKLQRRMIRQEQSARGNENLATPRQAAELMARILRCDLPIGANACAEMKDILAIPHDGPIAAGTPVGVRLLHKAGSINGVRTSWGVVDLEGRPYALAVMGNYGDTQQSTESITKVAEFSYWYFSRLAGSTSYGTRVPVDLLDRVQKK